MGKYILILIVLLVAAVGLLVVGYSAGVTAQNGHICSMSEDSATGENVCIVDGVTYVPQEK